MAMMTIVFATVLIWVATAAISPPKSTKDVVRNGEGILGEFLDFKRYLELTSVDVFDQLKTAQEKRIKTLDDEGDGKRPREGDNLTEEDTDGVDTEEKGSSGRRGVRKLARKDKEEKGSSGRRGVRKLARKDTEEKGSSGRRGVRKLARKDKKGPGSDGLVIEMIEKKNQPEYRINNGTD